MCGIAGIVRFDDLPAGASRAVRMRDALRHRGPDGEGIAELGRCTLVHTRLGVIDLQGGRQPMSIPARGDKGRLTLVFNGEIYNHRTLRKQLTMLGHTFASDHCDTEVLLHGYRQWGRELPKRLHGMFAFAIWDDAKRELFLCRDRVGKKPLYLHWAINGGARELSFGSTIASLAAGAQSRFEINRVAMLTFLRFGYTFGASMIEGIEEVPAAYWMIIDGSARVERQKYWQPPPISRHSTSLGALRATRELIEEAVHKRLEADVPLGCFLSGGIDSSIVAAIAQKQLRERGGDRLKTYCVAMPDLDYDESAHALLVANHLDTRHRQLVAEQHESVIPDLQRLIAIMGEPTADSSILPTFWLCQAARQEVTVALCGDGGDELFGGYDRYRAMRILARSGWWLRLMPLTLLRSANPRSRRHRFARLVEAARKRSQSQQYHEIVRLFSDDQIRDLALESDGPWVPRDTGAPLLLPDWPIENDPAHAAMRWDLMHYLPFDLLRKMDRASMAVALEVRCPLLDTQVLDLAGHLPTSVLMPGGRAKGLLRDVATELGLPQSIVNRPKRGFALPIGRWFRGPLKDALSQHIIDGKLDAIGIDRYAAEQMLDEHNRGATDHTHRLFALLMMSLWAAWLKGAAHSPPS